MFALFIIGILCVLIIMQHLFSWRSSYGDAYIVKRVGWKFFVITIVLLFYSYWGLLPLLLRVILGRVYVCPKCGRLSWTSRARKVRSASLFRKELREVTWHCPHCGTFTTKEEISEEENSNSGNGNISLGNIFSGSWGGGKSSGGGAGRNW